MSDKLVKLYPSKRGIKDGSKLFQEIFATNMVSVYPELAFHDNRQDAKFIVEHKAELAQALCKGICQYFGTSYIPKKEAPPQQPTECEGCCHKEVTQQLIKGIQTLMNRYNQ